MDSTYNSYQWGPKVFLALSLVFSPVYVSAQPLNDDSVLNTDVAGNEQPLTRQDTALIKRFEQGQLSHFIEPLATSFAQQLTSSKEIVTRREISLRRDLIAKNIELVKITVSSGKQLFVQKKMAYENNNGTLVWQGSVVNANNSLIPGDNEVVFVKNKKGVSGTIRYDGKLVKIEQSSSTQYWLNEVDESEMPPDHSPDYQESESITNSIQSRFLVHSPTDVVTQKAQSNTPVIRLLVGYTSEALKQNSNMDALIELAIAETNLGFSNSGVNALVELAHSYELNYAESGNHGTDLDRFHKPSDGYMDDVHTLRDEHKADVAVILIGNASSCGRAREIGAHEDTAFLVVKDSCATGYYSFGHELGHLMSARHNPEKDTKTTPYSFGHGFLYSSGGWRSIMSYNSKSCCTRQNFWSDPTRSYLGVKRGSVKTHDNARVLNLTAATIAAFKDEPTDVVNTPPLADFSTDVTDLTAVFTDLSSDVDGNIESYLWSFGDSKTSIEKSPSHRFETGGDYTISLTVTDASGASNTKTALISVSLALVNQPPTPKFTFNIEQSLVNFIDQSNDTDGQVVSWLWDFGNGEQSTLQNPQHDYQSSGNYGVSLTVVDDSGSAMTTSQQLTITVQQRLAFSNFESGFGAWANVKGDDWDWTLISGSTPSKSTGPFTGAGQSGKYAFIETSKAKGAYIANETAYLQSEEFIAENLRLSLDYHLFGANIGRLSVDVKHNGIWDREVWFIEGQQQSASTDNFEHVDIPLTQYSGKVIVRLRMNAAGGYKGDMALDNVALYGDIIKLPNSKPTFNTSAIDLGQIYVGTSRDFDLSQFASDKDEGDILSFSLTSARDWLSLNSTGQLRVLPSNENKGSHTFNVNVTDSTGDSAQTSVSIDIVNAPSTPTIIASMNFEDGLTQGWNNHQDANNTWNINSGKTSSGKTGPLSGASATPTKYAYLETSKSSAYYKGDTAYLDSPLLGGSQRNLAFSYHMYGADIGSLNVDIYHKGNWSKAIVSRKG